MSLTGLDANGDLLPFHVDNRDPEQVAMEYLAARKQGKSIEEAVGLKPLPEVVKTGDTQVKLTVPDEVIEEALAAEPCCGPDGGCACKEERTAPVPHTLMEQESDMVAHPPHYNFGTIEVIDVLEDWNVSYMIGNVIKYVARAPHKGNEIQDLKKAQFYLNREIERLEREAGS